MKNENVKESPERSKNVLEEKRKNGQTENLHKKDQHLYNNCYELRSRAINQEANPNLNCPKVAQTLNTFYNTRLRN